MKSSADKKPCHTDMVVQPDKEALIKRLNRIEGRCVGGENDYRGSLLRGYPEPGICASVRACAVAMLVE